MNKNVIILLLAVALSPIACTMAPKYTRPNAPVPADWPTGVAYKGNQAMTNAPAGQELKWEEFFADPKLQKVLGLALTNNRDLRIAALNVEQTRSLYGIRRAELFPTVNANLSGFRERVPASTTGNDGNKAQILSGYSANLGVASWEIDFFGRIRSLKNRALQEFFASEQARRSAQILLLSSVANSYLALAADQESLAIAQTTLKAQQGMYDLIVRRHNLGLAPELDVRRAQTQVDTARGDVARFQQFVAEDQNALNLLLGGPIPSELLPATLAAVTPPTEISAGLSSEVLLSRPDVLQSEDLLKAAYADIGAARAAFFPRISLTAAAGTASSELSGLFKGGSGAWSYAPQIVMPIFDARTWSALRASKVQQSIAVTQYERSIQNAFREVADALAVRGSVGEQLAAQQSLVDALTATYRLSTSRYDKGIDSYLSVLDAQRNLYAGQQGLVSLRLAKVSNHVRLYAVLGGGWQSQTAPTPPLKAPSAFWPLSKD